MGTAIGIDVRDAGVPDAAVDEAFVRLAAIEARFSTYRPDSEVSRYGRGEIDDDDLSAEFREVLRLCEAVRISSGGAFDVAAIGQTASSIPPGLVKGWAVDEAAAVLERRGARNYAINAGGDILARGEPSPGRAWRVGRPASADPGGDGRRPRGPRPCRRNVRANTNGAITSLIRAPERARPACSA